MAASSSSESSRSTSDNEVEPTDPTAYVLPGPYRYEVLRRRTQKGHVSQSVWNNEKDRPVKTRRGKIEGGPPHDDIPPVVADYLTQAGFIHVARMQQLQIDTPLISALVERWRPETHTFHMTQGEMTITLQDVSAILGLPTDGRVVTGATVADWPTIIEAVFGIEPEADERRGGDLHLSYLDDHYPRWDLVADDPQQIIYFTKAHIARMLGTWLVPDRSGGSYVGSRYVALLAGGFDQIGTYSWGSAVLAYLFRQLCVCTDPKRADMGGCHVLLQIWAWSRFPPLAPSLPTVTQP